MKQRFQTLKILADRFRQEIEIANQELCQANISPMTKDTILKNLVRAKMITDDVCDTIEDAYGVFQMSGSLNLQDMESEYVIHALKQCNGCIEKSAEWLGISTRTMSRRIGKLKIDMSIYRRTRKEYTIPSRGKYTGKYEGIVSWISDRKKFWLDELKKDFGYDSEEGRIPVNTVINFLRGKQIITCCGRTNNKIQYALADNVNKNDIMAYFNKNKQVGTVLD